MRAGTVALLLALACAACRPPSAALALPFVLRPEGSGPELFVTQEVVFHLPLGQTERVLVTVENGATGMAIVASTPAGQTLFIIRVKAGEALLDSRVPLPKEFNPRLLAVLIQMAEWPVAEVRRGLAAGMTFEEAGPVRTLHQDGKLLLTLQRTGTGPPYRAILLSSPRLGLRIDITTLDD